MTGPVLKSLAFVLVTALATGMLALSVAGTSVGSTNRYKAWFTDTTGLIEGDSVRIGGVEVGEVTSIEVVQRRYAQVEFTVAEDRALPASATASVKYLNMVGQRYLALRRGTGEVGRTLRPGATIPLERTTPALDLTQLFNGFRPLFQGLSPRQTNELAGSLVQVLQGEGGTVTGLVRTIGSLTTTLARKDHVIGEVVDNLNTVLGTVNRREKKFSGLITTLERLVDGFAEDRKPIGEAVDAMGSLSASTSGLLRDGRAPLKRNIREVSRLSGNLADSAPQVENFLRRTPRKMRAIGRTASYGSWLNLYLCEARVTGVTTGDGSPPPTGVALTDARCRP
nr:MCE family protein [Streptomyces boncukensis]